MLPPVSRLPRWLLGGLLWAALLAHGAVLVSSPWWLEPAPSGIPWSRLGALAGALLFGRVLLAWLPPGEVGGHAPRALPATLATSLALGGPLVARLAGETAWLAAGIGLALALLARVLTLPGAMVPRHGVAAEPWRAWDALAAGLGLLWSGLLLASPGGSSGLLGFASALLVFQALGVARRARAGRQALLALGAATPLVASEGVALRALALALGAAALVPWLRRHDRRAGALAGIGFGSLFLGGPDPLAFAAALVFVSASHPRQRRFAASWVGAAGALAALAWLLAPHGLVLTARARLLYASLFLEQAFDAETWGLAWPLLGLGLVLGALTIPWREPHSREPIEAPRREALALASLVAACALALLVPLSPWGEEEALALLFAPATLLVGLVLLPDARARGAA